MKNKKLLIGIVAFLVLGVVGLFIGDTETQSDNEPTTEVQNEVIEIIPHELNEYGQELSLNGEADVFYTLPVGTYKVSLTSEKYPEQVNIYDANNNYEVPADSRPQLVYPQGTIEVTIKEGYVVGFGATSTENPTIIFEKVS